MIEDKHLHLFITEDLYKISDENPNSAVDQNVTKDHIDIAVLSNPLSDIQKALLTKILAAVNVDINDVKLVYTPEDISFTFEKLLVFGPKMMPGFEESDLFSILQAKDGEILISKSLKDLEASVTDKSKLWNTLKTWFKV